ncbi:MAG: HIT family protein [Planctomycetota bacterium]|jgi:histidine triad (HIT) family protein
MASIFTKIVRGEIPADKVYEDEGHLAFLDINPIQPGHTLVIPKDEVSYLFDLSPAAYDELWRAVRTVEAGVKQATGCERVCLAVIGYEVPHVHIHLIPTNELGDWPLPPSKSQGAEARAALAASIRDALSAG